MKLPSIENCILHRVVEEGEGLEKAGSSEPREGLCLDGLVGGENIAFGWADHDAGKLGCP